MTCARRVRTTWRSTFTPPALQAKYNSQKLAAEVANAAESASNACAPHRNLAWARRCEAGETVDMQCLGVGSARFCTCLANCSSNINSPPRKCARRSRDDGGLRRLRHGLHRTAEAYTQGGYETGPVSRVAPEVEGVLMSAMRELLK